MARKGYIDNTGRNINFYDEDKRGADQEFKTARTWRDEQMAVGPARQSLFSRLKNQQDDPALASSNLAFLNDTEETSRNALLGIDSFLQFPLDLGTDTRHRHFMLFNIYKGTSDKLDAQLRDTRLLDNTAPGVSMLTNGTKRSDLARAGSSEGLADDIAARIAAQTDGLSVQDWKDQNADTYTALKANAEAAFRSADLSPGSDSESVRANIQVARDIDQNKLADSTIEAKYDNQSLWYGVPVIGPVNALVDAATASAFGPDPDNKREPPPKNLKQINSRGRQVQVDNATAANNRRFVTANIRSKDTIALYMSQNHSMSDSFAYAEKDLGALAMITQFNLGTAMIEGSGVVADTIASMVNDVPGLEFGGDIDFKSMRDIMRGGVRNGKKELMFGEPGLRSFSFDYDFFPRSQEESNRVADIIQMFRYHAYPRLQTAGGHFYMFPAEFEIEFYVIVDDLRMGTQRVEVNGYIPKIARCGLNGVNVAYTPNNTWTTFPDGSPTGVRLSLSFQELQALHQDNIINGY